MNCRTVRKYLSPFMDGELPEEASGRIRSHLRACAACRGRHTAWLRLQAKLLQGDLPDVPEDFAARVMLRVTKQPEKPSSRVSWWIPAGIYAAVFTLTVLLGLVAVPGPVSSARTAAASNPDWVDILAEGGSLHLAQVHESGLTEIWNEANASP